MISFQTSDGQQREWIKGVACMSKLVRGQIENDEELEMIPLPACDAKTLDKVKVYCDYIKIEGNERPVIPMPLRKEF